MTGSSYQAVLVEDFGPPESHGLKAVPRSDLPTGCVRMTIAVTGVSFVDVLISSGEYQVKPPLPFTPGTDFAGVVSEVADDVRGLKVGDRIVGSSFAAGMAEEAVIPALAATKLPDAVSFIDAVALRTNYATAWHALKDRANMQPGESLLVLGASGGVGIASVQIGKLMGATVIAAASDDEKRQFAIACGADIAIDGAPDKLRDALRAEGFKAVDVTIDPVGGETTEPAFRHMAWGGRHLVIGFAGGGIPKLPTNLSLLKGAGLLGVDIARFSNMHQPEKARANLDLLLDMVAKGELSPAKGEIRPLKDFAAAMQDVASRKARAKEILIVDEALAAT